MEEGRAGLSFSMYILLLNVPLSIPFVGFCETQREDVSVSVCPFVLVRMACCRILWISL